MRGPVEVRRGAQENERATAIQHLQLVVCFSYEWRTQAKECRVLGPALKPAMDAKGRESVEVGGGGQTQSERRTRKRNRRTRSSERVPWRLVRQAEGRGGKARRRGSWRGWNKKTESLQNIADLYLKIEIQNLAKYCG